MSQFESQLDTRGTSEYGLRDVFNFGNVQGGHSITNKVGTWTVKNGLNIDSDLNDYKYYRRWNFQQLSMRMAAVVMTPPEEFDPELVIGRQFSPGVPVITKTSATILNVVADVHNFKYKYTVSERWIGDFDENNAKVVATSLYHREQDISPVLRFMTEIHEKINMVHPPLTSIETRFYYRIPTHGAGKFENRFLRPLSAGAWAGALGGAALCALGLLLAARLERRAAPAQYAVFSVLASFSQQFFEDNGDHRTSRVSSARKLTVLVTGISCVLIYNYYTSSVVSWLLNGPPPSITSLQELLESPLELIFEDIGYTRSWLQSPGYYFNKRNARVEDELRRKKVFNKKKDAPLLVPLDEGIEMVKAGGYAYHTEVSSANALISRKFTQSELCELGSLQAMDKTVLYPAVQKHSPYREFFVWSLARLTERGVVSCTQRRISAAPVACEGSAPRALALGGALPAFILLFAGYVAAVVIMVIERYYKEAKPPTRLDQNYY